MTLSSEELVAKATDQLRRDQFEVAVSVSFRASIRFKRLLEAAAGHKRSRTNELDAMLLAPDDSTPKSKTRGRAKR